MLFLSRLTNESIMIGDDIEIKIARIEGASVCIGVQAPKEIAVNRKEVHEKIKAITKKNYTRNERDTR